ncbi:MAG: helix-turn-helix domain-containing protein [Mycobacteriales bacterium]
MTAGPSDARPDEGRTLGAALREAREAAGRTVEQVSADTRIRATLVRDLEADRFGSSGGSVYARGHIKSIASTLRVDAAPLLALFDRAQGTAAPAVPLLADPAPAEPAVTSFGGSAFAASAAALTPERTGPRWGLALGGAAAVLGVILGIGYLSSPGSSGPSPAALGSSTPSATPSPAAPAPVTTPPPDSVASKPAVTGAQLRLRLIGGDSWVSVSNGTSTLFEGLLHNGEFKDFSDPTRLKVVVGNAYAVNLNCGGKDSGPAGGSGSVKRFACTAAGLAAL